MFTYDVFYNTLTNCCYFPKLTNNFKAEVFKAMDEATENFYTKIKQENPLSKRGPMVLIDRELEIEKIVDRRRHPKTKDSQARISYLPEFKKWGNLTFEK